MGGGGILVGGHARKWPTQVWSSQGIAGHGKQWGRAGTSWFTSLWVEAIPQPRPAASAAPAVVWLSDTITYTSRPCSLPSAAGSDFCESGGLRIGKRGSPVQEKGLPSTVCSRKAESWMTCKYGLSAETSWERKEISWVSVYFLGCKRQMDKINETKSIPSSNTMMFPFLLMIDLSFSEAKNSVNLFKPSLSWTQGYKASLWEALSLAVWIAVASPSGSSPSGSRVRSVSPPGDSAMDAHHITSKHLYPVSKDRSSLPPTTQPLPSSCWLSYCPTEEPWCQLLWVFGRAVALPWEPFLPFCWHKSWTQATLALQRLSWPLSLYRLPLALNFPIFPQILGNYSNTSLFSLCYFRKLGCSLTIRWLCLWGQRLESSISRPQHGHIRNAVNVCPVNFSASFRS